MLFEQDREELAEGKFQELSLAQDVRAPVFCIKLKRLEANTWRADTRLMRAMYEEKFKALDTVDMMKLCRDRYCTYAGQSDACPSLVDKMKELMRNACVDGAAVERLATRMSKEKLVFPHIDMHSRCNFHSAEGVITTVIRGSPLASEVLRVFVDGKAYNRDSRDATGQGFARFVTNSQKWRRKMQAQAHHDFHIALTGFAKEMLDAGWHTWNVGFAPQRVDTLGEPLANILMQLGRNLDLILEEEGDPNGQQAFASGFLDFCTYYNLAFAASLSEYLLLAQAWVHRFDNCPEAGALCRVATNNQWFLDECEKMFMGESPLVLQAGYTNSVLNRLLRGLTACGTLELVSARRRRFLGIPSSWAERVKPLAEMHNIVKLTRAAVAQHFPSAHLQEAMAPFDLDNWNAHPRALKGVLAPLAVARKVDPSDAEAQFCRALVTANSYREALGTRNPDLYWQKTLCHLKAEKTLPALAAISRPTLAQFNSTAEIEQNFSQLQQGEGAGRRHCGEALLNAEMKIRLDGPHPASLLTHRSAGSSPVVSEFIRKVQAMYFKLYPCKDLTKAIATRQQLLVPKFNRRQGVPAKPKKDPPPTRAGWKRQRETQRDILSAGSSSSKQARMIFDRPSGQPSLFDIVALEAANLWTEERETKRAKMLEKEKQANHSIDVDKQPPGHPERAKKLAEKEGERHAAAKAMSKVRISSVGENARSHRYVPRTEPFFIYGERLCGEQGLTKRQQLEHIHLSPCAAKSLREACTGKAVHGGGKVRLTHCFVASLEDEARLRPPSVAAILARLLGTVLVEQHWLDVSLAAGRFVQSPLLFGRKLEEQRYILLHPSFLAAHGPFANVLKDILRFTPMEQVRWYLKDNFSELKQPAHSLILVSDDVKPTLLATASDWQKRLAEAQKNVADAKSASEQCLAKQGHISASLAGRYEASLTKLEAVKKASVKYPIIGKIWSFEDFWAWLGTPG